MGTPLRVLIVEDSEDDAELLLLELRQGGFEPAAERVETEEAMCAALGRQSWDLIIADYALPHFSAPAALAVLRDTDLDVPFIVVSGKIGEETAVVLMKAGAHDYIMKDNLTRFLPAVQRELREAEVRRERRRAQQALRRETDRLQALVDGLARTEVGIDIVGIDYRVRYQNQLLIDRFGDLTGQLCYEKYMGRETPCEFCPMVKAIATRRVESAELTGVDGRHYELLAAPLPEPDGTVDKAIEVLRDITDRKRLEKEVLEIGDAERRRLGQDLHEGVGQELTGIRFMASALARKLAARSAPEAEDARAITRLLDETAEQARALARGMCPLELVSGDLVPAFEELALTAGDRFDITCQLQCEDPAPVVDDATVTHLYHIAQEAVTNAVKHGKAKRVEIALATEGGRTTLAVKDDGVGLPDDVDGLKGLGLRIMRYRAAVMGASLDVRRHAEGGTIVVCSVPSNSRGEAKGGEETEEARAD